MICIYCGAKTAVRNSRGQKRANQKWRRRQCVKCKAIFTTLESVDLSKSLTVEKNGGSSPFLSDLLYTEVLLAVQDRKNCYIEARELTNTIISKILADIDDPKVDSKEICRIASEVLKRFNRRAWMRYSAEHPSIS